MEKKHTDKKNYLSVRIKWCALLATGLIGAVLVEMWTVCIREMRPFTIPAVFTVLFAPSGGSGPSPGSCAVQGDEEDI